MRYIRKLMRVDLRNGSNIDFLVSPTNGDLVLGTREESGEVGVVEEDREEVEEDREVEENGQTGTLKDSHFVLVHVHEI